VPQAAAVWSADPRQMWSFPARFLAEFFDNHGMLGFVGRPRWRAIRGGSALYVAELTAPWRHRLRLRAPVEAISRADAGVFVRARGGEAERFDEVVLATHSDQALALLADATTAEHEVLGAIPYQENEAVLHTDVRMLPRRRRAWASWNYHLLEAPIGRATVTYHMNRLQSLSAEREFCVTLNRTAAIAPEHVIRTISYAHPVYTSQGVRAQARVNDIRYRLALAYVDLEELPGLLDGALLRRRPGLVRFRRSDYLGDPARGLGDVVRDEVLRQTGVRPAGPIRLLTQLRSWGHCFNPVSFYYCFGAMASGERLEDVVAEVTNTPWGERHAYVLSRDGEDPGALAGSSVKMLHVSPFMGMDYTYGWRVSPPSRRLEVHIESVRNGSVAFDATLCMRRHELTRASLGRTAARYPFATLRVLALIYGHAARLKMKGVPVRPHPRVEATSR